MMGPVSRVAQYKQIESTYGAGNLQQLRWPPSLIADTPQDALARLYMLPGAHYNDPEFSWKYPTLRRLSGLCRAGDWGRSLKAICSSAPREHFSMVVFFSASS